MLEAADAAAAEADCQHARRGGNSDAQPQHCQCRAQGSAREGSLSHPQTSMLTAVGSCLDQMMYTARNGGWGSLQQKVSGQTCILHGALAQAKAQQSRQETSASGLLD